MGLQFDLIKLAILVWFLAPFGYNASDVIFEQVKAARDNERMLTLSCRGRNSPQCEPPDHIRDCLRPALVQVLDPVGLLSPVCRLPGPRLNTSVQNIVKKINADLVHMYFSTEQKV